MLSECIYTASGGGESVNVEYGVINSTVSGSNSVTLSGDWTPKYICLGKTTIDNYHRACYYNADYSTTQCFSVYGSTKGWGNLGSNSFGINSVSQGGFTFKDSTAGESIWWMAMA